MHVESHCGDALRTSIHFREEPLEGGNDEEVVVGVKMDVRRLRRARAEPQAGQEMRVGSVLEERDGQLGMAPRGIRDHGEVLARAMVADDDRAPEARRAEMT
jgi:hypothetical protein